MIATTPRNRPGGEPAPTSKTSRAMLRRAVAPILLAVILIGGQAGPVGAQQAEPDAETILTEATTVADGVEASLDRGRLNGTQIEEKRAALEERRNSLQDLAQATKVEIEPLSAELDALGPAPDEGSTEPEEIATKRAELLGKLAPLNARLRKTQVRLARIQTLADRLVEFRRERFTREILQRQPTPLSPQSLSRAWASLKIRSATIVREVRARLDDDGAEGLADRLALPLLLAIAAFALAVWLRRRLIEWIRDRVDGEVSTSRRARLTAAITLVRLILPSVGVAMAVIGLRQSGVLGPNGMVLIFNGTIAAACLIAAYAFGGAFFAAQSSGLRISGLTDEQARHGYRWYLLLTFVVVLDQFLVAAGHELRLTIEAMSVLNAAFTTLGGLALWRLIRAIGLGKAPEEDGAVDDERRRVARFRSGAFHVVLTIVAIIAPLLALSGFFAASRFLFYPVVYSFAVIGAAKVIYLWVVAISSPERTEPAEGEALGDEAPQSVMPVIAGSVLTLLVLPILAIIWGARATDLSSAWSMVVEGFQIGEITVSPMDFVLFAIVFTIGYLITRIIQGVLRRSVMPVLRVDEGAKAALLAGVGYAGVVIAALVAISTTALDLSNLAIVFGALSVGIGFGLQNIVNNFVSGIILLIERPIKVGDWVEIGGTHGMVRRINVRSTQIQTFDRSTMFVPNADLISGTVTNWYHGAGQGRLKLAVGVAYGTDARKVEQILLEAAAAHPMVLRTPAPFVIFRDFGASSLDFELRGIMADVNMILTLPSELRYSIYRRFNEEGIEIPFPQQDITIRNVQELKGLGGASD